MQWILGTFPTTVIEYLKAMQRHFGKVVAVVDRASPHRAKSVKELLRENKNIKIIYLSKGSSYLNAVGVLASGKASSARLRILQDIHGHVQCNLHVL